MTTLTDYIKNKDLLAQALTHRSWCNEHPGHESNERLEFLGDAVLSLAISWRLYQLLPNATEGELTNRRSSLVQTSTLALKAKVWGLDRLLRLSRGEEESGGRKNPGLLANTFEAVLGAVYLDSGWEGSLKFLAKVFPQRELSHHKPGKDAKSLLQEKVQAKGLRTPIYRTVAASGPDHAKRFAIEVVVNGRAVGRGEGRSKQTAQTAAAAAALARLFKKG